MKKKKITVIIIVAMLVGSAVGCSALDSTTSEVVVDTDTTEENTSGINEQVSSEEEVVVDPTEVISSLAIEEMFTNNELTFIYDTASATSIALTGESVTIDKEGTYILSGTISDGQIVVDVEESEKVFLVLDGVDVTSSSSAALYLMEADKVFVVLAEGSTNKLTTTGEFVNEDDTNIDGTIFSKSDISFLGTGSLEIYSEYGHGIVGKDDVVFIDGTYIISAGSHGINANDSIRIANADFTIVSGKDGMKAENEDDYEKGYIYIADGKFNIESEEDAISSSSMIQIDGGEFSIYSGGGFVEVLNDITVGEGAGNTQKVTDTLENSMKCIKACNIEINGGDMYISSYEDALHADCDMTINGGKIHILSGDDAVHAENNLTINDVELVIEEAYEGIEACYIYLNGGAIEVNVYDDAINATESYGLLHITGGEIYLSSVGDGLDSNGDLTIEGGTIVIDCDPIYSGGDGSVDVSGEVTYTGGTIVDADGNEIDPTAGLTSGGMGNFFQMAPSNNRNNARR